MHEDMELNPKIRNWATHKASPIIAAGLVAACSLVEPADWYQLESTSNAAEQAGSKGYKTGVRCSLLEAVQKHGPLV